jgi:hypothetical protein
MKVRWLRYLGLLGVLGIVGLVTGNVGWYGFFGFFGFSVYNGSSDERLDANVNRSALNAFVSSVIVCAAAMVCATFSASPVRVYAIAFAVNYGLQILIFAISLAYFEKRGDEM